MKTFALTERYGMMFRAEAFNVINHPNYFAPLRENVATLFWSVDGVHWHKANSYEVSGYNHNIGDGFLSLRPALFASGTGEVFLKEMTYHAIRG